MLGSREGAVGKLFDFPDISTHPLPADNKWKVPKKLIKQEVTKYLVTMSLKSNEELHTAR